VPSWRDALRFYPGLALAIALLEGLLYWLDPGVQLYWGDSAEYLLMALRDAVAGQRSLLYGDLVEALVGGGGSLQRLVCFQIALLVLTCVLLAAILREHLGAGPLRSALAAGVVALLPVHAVWTRYVLTETSYLACVAAFALLTLDYLRSGRLVGLAGVAGLGLLGVALRPVLLPVALGFPLGLPLLRAARAGRARAAWRAAIVHLCVAATLVAALHMGYRALFARRLSAFVGQEVPPGYASQGGFYLMGFVMPLLRPDDFPPTVAAEEILGGAGIDPDVRDFRSYAAYEKLRDELLRAAAVTSGPEHHGEVALELARRAAWSALRRDPLGLARLTLGTLRQHLESDHAERLGRFDLGLGQEFPPWFRRFAVRELGFDPAARPASPSLLQRAYLAHHLWISFVAWSFLLVPLGLLLQERATAFAWSILGVLFLVLDLSTLVFSVSCSGRYLVAASALLVVLLAGFRPDPSRLRRGVSILAAVRSPTLVGSVRTLRSPHRPVREAGEGVVGGAEDRVDATRAHGDG
jgi:hypothetical protein